VNKHGRVWEERQEVFLCFKYPSMSRGVVKVMKKMSRFTKRESNPKTPE
jgi:hypothetical protein